jgi:hypothetical protein
MFCCTSQLGSDGDQGGHVVSQEVYESNSTGVVSLDPTLPSRMRRTKVSSDAFGTFQIALSPHVMGCVVRCAKRCTKVPAKSFARLVDSLKLTYNSLRKCPDRDLKMNHNRYFDRLFTLNLISH